MYKYHRPGASIGVRFQFRKTRIIKRKIIGTADALPTYDGTVQVELTINRNQYGPFSTGINTFRATWDGRQSSRPSTESKDLIRELSDYQAKVESTHYELVRSGQTIDGELLINAVRGGGLDRKDVTLIRVYGEFMQSKKAMIETQDQRSVDQISQSTYDSYPKRWDMIHGFLVSIKRAQLPAVAVTHSLATELKEWLTKQTKVGGRRYKPVTINKSISFLKQLMTYALSKGYVEFNPVRDYACRGSSPADPKPLTKDQLDHLETCELPFTLRRICDSWLVAAELCLHYSDYMKLPKMKFIEKDGMQFIQHTRSKQRGSNLKQTVNVTDRAQRLIDKYGGVQGLYYRHSHHFSRSLKKIAEYAGLRDENGELVNLQFGQGRDSGLTQRAIDGANGIQLSKIAGWSRPAYAERYIGNPVDVVGEFVKSTGSGRQIPNPLSPLSRL